MNVIKKFSTVFLSIITFFILSIAVSGQLIQRFKPTITDNITAFPNPLLLDAGKGCRPENLNSTRFDTRVSTNQRMVFCETLQEVSVKLTGNWSPALKSEMQQIWQIFSRQNIKIRLMEENISSNVRAMAEAFTENTAGRGFNANLYLRPERAADKSFFPIFMHELRHIFDLYMLWKNKTNITEAELEKRAFRIVGKINQELPDNDRFSRLPSFWEDGWKHLSPNEIDRKREEKIERFMRSTGAYKHLLTTPEKYRVGYLSNQSVMEKEAADPIVKENKGEKLPHRLKIRLTENELPQQVKEISFSMEKAANTRNSDQLLRAALINEKNLYHKMDNFVYDQNLQLQCWKKQKVTENYELSRSITRTQNGETLFQDEKISSVSSKSPNSPSCVLDFDTIKSDATDTFWAAPYLDQMPIRFNYFTVIDGIPVARYTVFEPTNEKFNQIASRYPNIRPFRAFVGTIFVSVADSQIIRFWGTSFPESKATGYQSSRTYGSYSATAIRQKLASGIWITTLLNIVAVTNEKDKMKPFSYVVKYQNYRQGTTDVIILDDVEVVSKK